MNPFRFYAKAPPPAISLRPRQAAEALGVSVSTLERLTRAGEIPAAKVGRCTVYSVDSLKAWIASQAEGGSHAAH